MASRASLNKVLLIGNLTRDPELRYTPSGAAVCTFGVATNRTYVAADGTKREEAEFIRIVSWNKLAELCSQLLTKGRKVYVEGRLQTRSWETPDGTTRQTTEVVIDDMRILDSKRSFEEEAGSGVGEVLEESGAQESGTAIKESPKKQAGAQDQKTKKTQPQKKKDSKEEVTAGASDTTQEQDDKVDLDDLPF